MTTGHLAHLLEAFFGDGSSWGAHVTYVKEDRPLGTIGPVRRIPRPDTPFIVMNGYLLTDLNYRDLYEYHLASGSMLSVAVYKTEVPVSLGVIEYDEERRIIGFREKPCLAFWASMGIYVCSPGLWDAIPPNVYYGFDNLMEDLIKNGKTVKVFPWNGIWLDIGRPEDYEKAAEVLEKHRKSLLPTREGDA